MMINILSQSNNELVSVAKLWQHKRSVINQSGSYPTNFTGCLNALYIISNASWEMAVPVFPTK